MQEQRQEGDLQPSGNPKVLIVNIGEQQNLLCDYNNASIIHYSTNRQMPVVNFLNDKVATISSQYDYVLYMNDDFVFANQGTLTDIMDEFKKEELSLADGLYFDLMSNMSGWDVPTKFYPSVSANLYYRKYIMNSPFIVKVGKLPTFSQYIKSMFLWNGFIDIVLKVIMFHVPKQYFKAKNAFKTQDAAFGEDIAVINELYK